MVSFFSTELEGVATYWRIYRRDGIALAFTSHDRALYFGGMVHRAAPGMLPSAIRTTNQLSSDSAEMEGVLTHDSISGDELAAGLFDGARIEVGAVDWETLENLALFTGTIGKTSQEENGFNAELRSAKAELERDLVPRTSPTCRAEFCGPGCNLSAAHFTQLVAVQALDPDANTVTIPVSSGDDYIDGRLRFLAGPQTGQVFGMVQAIGQNVTLDKPIAASITPGTIAEIRQGCDHTLATCQARFANAANFRGEPFLPGNDLLARYARPQ